MSWGWIVGGILLFGLLQTAVLARWLWLGGRALVAELGVLAVRSEELAEVLDGIRWPAPTADTTANSSAETPDAACENALSSLRTDVGWRST